MMPPAGLSADFVDQAAALVCRRAGLYFDQKRRPQLEAGLGNALRRSGASVTPAEYLQRLDREPELFDDLLAELTVGETYFFRDQDQFGLLRERAVPELLARRPEKLPLRIWSAGCASGEEPYSVAILLHQLGALTGARIVGTDISRPLLRRARRARYTSWSLRGVPDDMVRRYFTPAGGGVALAATVRDAVEFRYLNLAAPSYPSLMAGVWEMDLILCRNVLIYFAPSLIAEVGARLAAALSDDGWLLLGSADPLLTEIDGPAPR
jgi:chemotaxis protein methyltransferase CheR